MSTEPITLYVAPPPTPNGPLHVGHLAGPYLTADIAARAAAADGRPVRTLCGLDQHQNYVPARAEQRHDSPLATAAEYGAQIQRGLRLARIDYDLFTEPLGDGDYQRGVGALLDAMIAGKAAIIEATELAECAACGRTLHHARVSGACPTCGEAAGGGTCEGCGSFLVATTLRSARSACCDAPARPVSHQVPVLKLAEYVAPLTAAWSSMCLPHRVRALLERQLSAGLPEVVLAYPSDWGIGWSGAGTNRLRIDVWVEMGLGYLYTVARNLDPTAATPRQWANAWARVRSMWCFLGLDNAFYYSTLFPALFHAAGVPAGTVAGLVVNEFYQLDSAKFSTSRDHAIWAHEMLSEDDPGTVRAFLSYDAPTTHGTDFTRERFEAFRDWYRSLRDGAPADRPGALAGPNVARAHQALRPETFDHAMAIRAGLDALAAGDDRASALLDLITADRGGRSTGRGTP